MGKIMEKFNKLTLPAVILIASVILGGFIFATQVIKQQSIEKQQQIKIKQEKWDQLAKELKEQQGKGEAKQAKHQNVLLLETCLDNAEKEADERNQIVLDNAIGVQVDSVYKTLDDIEIQLDKNKDECFKRYPQR